MSEEIIYNVMLNYKVAINHHVQGMDCWCKPTQTKMFLIHRNYEWNGSSWLLLKDPSK